MFRENLFRVSSGLHCQFTKWPTASADSMLSCELNGQGSNPTRGPPVKCGRADLRFFGPENDET